LTDKPRHRLLFAREIARDFPVQLSTHHLAAAAESLGNKVLWATRPVALNCFSRTRLRANLPGQYQPLTPLARTRRFQHCLKTQLKLARPNAEKWLTLQGVDDVDVLWIADPYLGALRAHIPHRRFVMQVTDDYRAFENWGADMAAALPSLLREADAVFFSNSDLMHEYEQAFHLDAVRTLHLSHGIGEVCWPNLAPVSERKAVYVGSINAWMDWEWLRLLSDRYNLAIDFYGQQPLPQAHPLWFYRGLLPDAQRTKTLAQYDLGLLPFRPSPIKKYSEPMKLYDYLAAGLPMLSRLELPEWAAEFKRGVTTDAARLLSKNADNYYSMRIEHLTLCQHFAASNSWKARWQRAEEFIGLCA
jgi:hypothetical protein